MTIREKVILEGQETVSDAANKAGDGVEKMDGILKKAALAGGIAIAAAKLGQLGKAAIGSAIDAGEAAAAFETTFGPAVDGVAAFVDEFANKAGLANYQLEQMLATTGAVAQGMGFTEDASADLAVRMATLAGDVASFSNATGGSQAVLEALGSALNGEREALKTYGLAISEAEVQARALADTGKTTATELSRQDKALATLALAYDKAGKQVGDLDRTQDSTANTLRRLSAEFKEAGVRIGGKFLDSIDAILPQIEATIPALERLGASVANLLTGSLDQATEGGLSSRIVDGLAVVTNSFVDVGAAVVGGAAELVTWGHANTDALTAAQRNAEQMNDLIGIAENLRDGNLEQGPLGLANAMAELDRRGTLNLDTFDQLQTMFGVNGREAALAAQAILNSGALEDRAYKDLREHLEGLIDTEKDHASASWDVAEANRFAALQTDALATATATASNAFSDIIPGLDGYTAGLVAAYQAGETLASAQLALTDPVYRAMDAWSAYQDTLASVNEDGAVTADEFFDLTEAQLEMQDALSGIDAGTYEGFMGAMQAATGKSREEIELLLNQLGLFDGKTFTATVSTRFEGGAGKVFAGGATAFDRGGMVQGAPGEPIPAIVHGGEEVIGNVQRRSITDTLDRLAASMANASAGGNTIEISMPVYVQGGEDAGAAVIAQLQDANLEATLERLTRNIR